MLNAFVGYLSYGWKAPKPKELSLQKLTRIFQNSLVYDMNQLWRHLEIQQSFSIAGKVMYW